MIKPPQIPEFFTKHAILRKIKTLDAVGGHLGTMARDAGTAASSPKSEYNLHTAFSLPKSPGVQTLVQKLFGQRAEVAATTVAAYPNRHGYWMRGKAGDCARSPHAVLRPRARSTDAGQSCGGYPRTNGSISRSFHLPLPSDPSLAVRCGRGPQ